MKNILDIKNLRHSYGEHEVVKGLSLGLAEKSIGCLLGESGCGKTTVLRAIAGFEKIAGGKIYIDGRPVSTPAKTLEPHERGVGMVFQDYALFPHLTVEQNIAFGISKLKNGQKRQRIGEVLDLVGLASSKGKYPHELSGGQQQRVAIARALAPRPALLLLDEPFSNLDVTLRERLSIEVREIIKAYGATALLVTHNQAEAFSFADEVGVMREGVLEQWAKPFDLYHEPSTKYVAKFVGEGSFIKGVKNSEGNIDSILGTMEQHGHLASKADEVALLIRPEDVIHEEGSPTKGKILSRTFRGSSLLYKLALENGETVEALVPSRCIHELGEEIGIRASVEHTITFSLAAD